MRFWNRELNAFVFHHCAEGSDLFDDKKEDLLEKLEAKEDQMKDKIKDELDKMVEDGFMDEKPRKGNGGAY